MVDQDKLRSPLGQEQEARSCTKLVGIDYESNEVICGKQAKFHLIQDLYTLENAYCCLDCAREAVEAWHWDAYHVLGPLCGMPGALYFVEENVCRYDEDGIPVAWRSRRAEREEVAAVTPHS